jgi:aldehyde:ferredoxin oxidoreductase
MTDDIKGWRGRRLLVDLTIHRAWTEEIPAEELATGIGGRGLNGRYFLDRVDSPDIPSAPEGPVAFGVGPLSGTYAPCAAWTSISALSPLPFPSRYVHGSLPGHWGPQLKLAGFDQLIIMGKAEKPLSLVIGEGATIFKDGKHLWGKDTVETTATVEEEEADRNIEVLCIGPAGENRALFANATNRFSWTADHIGLGSILGSKNLKAIVVRGNRPVSLHDPDRFLRTCTALRQRIQQDPRAIRLREEGAFLLLRQKAGGFGIRNYSEMSKPEFQSGWASVYFTDYSYGKEACFSCPVHCGRTTDVNGNYFGGVHAESAWSLGPRIGIEDWGKTLLLHRICQRLGLDPSAAGSLLSWTMDCYEKGILSGRDLGFPSCHWGDEKAAIQLIESIVEQRGIGEVLRQGSFLAARSLGKGLEEVPHLRGVDLPIRDPGSSLDYALSRALFPMEWDYLQSLPTYSSSPFEGEVRRGMGDPSEAACRQDEGNGLMERVLAAESLRILADLNSLCPLVLARLPLLTAPDIEALLSAATGLEVNGQTLEAAVRGTIEAEKILSRRFRSSDASGASLPLRFFNNPADKNRVEKTLVDYELQRDSGPL